jgi:phosphate transport system permease protein
VSNQVSDAVPTVKPRINRTLQRIREKFIEWTLAACGLLSIAVTLAIATVVLYGSAEFFLYKDVQMAAPAVKAGEKADPKANAGRTQLQRMDSGEVAERVGYFFTGTEWTAGFQNPRYGILPILIGTMLVAVIAAAIALPIGLTTAIYLSEYASPRVRAYAKPTLELLAGIPTIVYGFFAVTTITPFLVFLFGDSINNPTNQLAGGIVVGIMIIPMVASLSEDALRAVPRALRDGAIALGANKFETSVKVVLPAALSGVTASFILAISRAIGETMAVSLACGDRTTFTFDPRQGLATMTSFIVRVAKGDMQHGTTDFNSMFAVAGMLFFMTLFMNLGAQVLLRRYRQVYQ